MVWNVRVRKSCNVLSNVLISYETQQKFYACISIEIFCVRVICKPQVPLISQLPNRYGQSSHRTCQNATPLATNSGNNAELRPAALSLSLLPRNCRQAATPVKPLMQSHYNTALPSFTVISLTLLPQAEVSVTTLPFSHLSCRQIILLALADPGKYGFLGHGAIRAK
jgi:hypothetical protein